MKPTWTSRRPAAISASMIRRQASSVVASGFSQNTGLPAAIAASTYSSCVAPQDATSTASTPPSAMRSWPVGCTVAAGQAGRDRLGAGRVDVGHRDDVHPGQHLGQPPDVVLADHAGADDPDPDRHRCSPPVPSGSPMPRPRR